MVQTIVGATVIVDSLAVRAGLAVIHMFVTVMPISGWPVDCAQPVVTDETARLFA